jgi:hypothetical protein
MMHGRNLHSQNYKGEPATVVFPIPFLTFFSKVFLFIMNPFSQTNQAAAPTIPPPRGNIIPLSPYQPSEGWLKNPAWIGEILPFDFCMY